jgi:hypothetical protein
MNTVGLLSSERIRETLSLPNYSHVLSHSTIRSLDQVHEEARADSTETSSRQV